MADSPERASKGALQRILERSDRRSAFDSLIDMPGSDLTTLLLGVATARADAIEAPDLMRQHRADRFVAPSRVDALRLKRIELTALETASSRFKPVELAPVAPFATHRALGGTPQNNVVTTMRGTEVAADPTSGLALEAAARRVGLLRADPRSDEVVRLAATQRVTRAQRFEGPRSFAHFTIFGLVAAGRDAGGCEFELNALAAQAQMLAAIVRASLGGDREVEVRLTAFNEYLVDGCDRLCRQNTGNGIAWSMDQSRTHGQGYYRNVCFKLHVRHGDEPVEVGDGGDVWWSRTLVQNNKERLVIGGLGLDRLAMLPE